VNRNIPVFIGFALFVLALVLSYYSSSDLVALTAITQSDRVAFHLLISAAEVVMLVILTLIFRRDERRFFRHNVRVSVSAAALGMLSFGLLMLSRQSDTIWFALAGSAITFGCALALLFLFWHSQLIHFSYRGSYLLIIAVHGAATFAAAGLLPLPFVLNGVTTPTALLLSCLCVALPQMRRRDDDRRAVQAAPIREALHLLRTGVISVCVFAFVSGLIQRNSGGAVSDPAQMQGFMLSASAIVLAVMLIPVLVIRKPLKLENSYRIALPLSTLGFIVVPLMVSGLPMGVSGILVTTGYMLTGIILYCTVAEVARVTGAPILPLLAGCEILSLGCYLVGSLASYPLSSFVAGDWGGTAIIGLALLYLALFFILSHSPRDRQLKSGGGEAIGIDPWGEAHGLNEREREILTLMLQGRTLSRIGGELGLSTSGIKYHAHSLYRKLGVNSRDELHSLIEDTSLAPNKVDAEAGLTAREWEVARLLASGMTLNAIAAELVISLNTAKSHVRTIYSKLGIHSKQELMDLLVR
jgi:DNA-binding NarL/FixJ family response regulator